MGMSRIEVSHYFNKDRPFDDCVTDLNKARQFLELAAKCSKDIENFI